MALSDYAALQLKTTGERRPVSVVTPNSVTPPVIQADKLFSFAPKAQTDDKNLSKEEVKSALLNLADKKAGLKKLIDSGYILEGFEDPKPEQGFFSGFADKTAEAFKGGLSRIGEAGEGIVNDKYTVGEGLMRGVAGAFQGAFSPLSGVVGQSIESFVPDSTKSAVGSFLSPAVTAGKEFYASQSPEQQRALDNLGVGLEVGANFLGAGAVGKTAGSEVAKTAVKGAIQGTKDALIRGQQTIRRGIDERAILASEKAGAKEAEKYFGKTVPAKFGDTIVDIQLPDQGVIATGKNLITKPFQETDTKRLVNSALKPTVFGKNPKARIYGIEATEKNAREFHKAIRTSQLTGEIDTLENAARSIVDNIDVVGARIGEAVKKLEGNTLLDPEVLAKGAITLQGKVAKRQGAFKPLQDFVTDTAQPLSWKDAFATKVTYSNEIKKLMKSGDAGTDTFKALVDGVETLNKQIDGAVESMGGSIGKDKAVYKMLKSLVDDISKSAQVDMRRAPQSLAEQIGFIDAFTSPIATARQAYAKEIANMNTRGGSWQQLVKILDKEAIQSAKGRQVVKPTKFTKSVKPTQIINLPKKPQTIKVPVIK